MTNNQLDKSRISKTITWLNYGRFDKCEKYAIRMVELILGYEVEKKTTYIFRNESGKKIKEITVNETERIKKLSE